MPQTETALRHPTLNLEWQKWVARSPSGGSTTATRCHGWLLADVGERRDDEMPAYHDSAMAHLNSSPAERVTATANGTKGARGVDTCLRNAWTDDDLITCLQAKSASGEGYCKDLMTCGTDMLRFIG